MNRKSQWGPGKLRLLTIFTTLFATALGAAAQSAAPQAPPAPGGNVHVFPVRGNVYMLTGAGSNITVQVGQEFIIVVDTGLKPYASEVIEAIRSISPLPILFVVNTSSDEDHVGGNSKISEAGWSLPNPDREGRGPEQEQEKDASRLVLPPGATIVANLKTINQIPEQTGKMAAITYGPEGFKLYNNEPVVFYTMPKAHIDSDTLVFFRTSDAISAGEIFSTTRYPVIDTSKGGSVDGILNALNSIIDLMVPRESEEGGTWVIPGHGHLSDRNDVVNYRDMVTIIRARIEDMAKRGMTLEQIKAARPTLDYDGIYDSKYDSGYDSGSSRWTAAMFIEAVYRGVTNKRDEKTPR